MSKEEEKLKRSGRDERERQVLLGLVDYYLKTGKPVGSNALKDAGFENLSSATIRNYFAHLEELGLLTQQHTSGGRIPTAVAFRLFAQEHLEERKIGDKAVEKIDRLKEQDTREIAAFLQSAADALGSTCRCAVFLSAPRFDHDYIVSLKLVAIDSQRVLCVIITDFGIIKTHVLHTEKRISSFSLKRIENYFQFRLTGQPLKEPIDDEETQQAAQFYNEIMVRYIVDYANFIDEELYRTAFSQLLSYPEFHDATAISSALSLFENGQSMRLLLRECTKINKLKYWIADDLLPYTSTTTPCAVSAIPYSVRNHAVGAIGILGPMRLRYRDAFANLHAFGDLISEVLTKNLYKHKITFRSPQKGTFYLPQAERKLLVHNNTKGES